MVKIVLQKNPPEKIIKKVVLFIELYCQSYEVVKLNMKVCMGEFRGGNQLIDV